MGIIDRAKHGFVTGLVLIAPVAVTVFVLRLLAGWATQISDPIVAGTGLARYTANELVVAQVLALLLVLIGITLLGYVAEWSVGRRLFGNVGRIVDFIPLVNVIYDSVRQVSTALVSQDSRYDRVVLVEFPRKGVYSIGLISGESEASIEEVTGSDTYNVYLPNTPNPTGGKLLLVPEDEVYDIDMSVRQAIRTVVTTGVGGEQEIPGLSAGIDDDPEPSADHDGTAR